MDSFLCKQGRGFSPSALSEGLSPLLGASLATIASVLLKLGLDLYAILVVVVTIKAFDATLWAREPFSKIAFIVNHGHPVVFITEKDTPTVGIEVESYSWP